MELHASTRRSATAVVTEEAHVIVVPKALYDAVLRTKQSAEMRAKFRVFRHVDWLTSLEDVDRRNVGYAMGLVMWPRGAVVVRRGSEFQGIMLLRRGHVTLLRPVDTGAHHGIGQTVAPMGGGKVPQAAARTEVVGTRGPGEMFGEQALLQGGVHPHTIIADTPLEVFCLSASVRPSSSTALVGISAPTGLSYHLCAPLTNALKIPASSAIALIQALGIPEMPTDAL